MQTVFFASSYLETHLLLKVSSGIHAVGQALHSLVSVSHSCSVRNMLADAGVPINPENGQSFKHPTAWIAP